MINNKYDKYRMYGIIGDNLERVWYDCIPFVKKALKYAGESATVDDTYHAICQSDLHLWCVYTDKEMKGIVVTQIKVYPRYKCLYIVLTAGVEFYEWAPVNWHIIDAFARAKGCKRIRIKGRKGWERHQLINEFGFTYSYTVMEKMVD